MSRHIDSAQAYKNEAGVGEAVREVSSKLKREEIFISMWILKSPELGTDEAQLRNA
jgi:diketogulonate reductase-like aldo/keto reductase